MKIDWRSRLIDTSKPLTTSEWGTVFGDPIVATAILDRLLRPVASTSAI